MKLLLLHGFTGRGTSWREVVRRLPGERLEIAAPDLPGHAVSGRDGPRTAPHELPASFEATVDLLAERHLTMSGVHVVGYSLGGRLALGLAVRHPHRLAGLTLIGARPGLGPAEARRRAEGDTRLAAELRRDLESFVDRWQELPLFESQKQLPPELREAQRRIRLGHDPRGLAWALETLSPGRMPDWRGHLAGLDLPVRLVAGELDETYVRIAGEMAARLPRASVHIVPGAGHNVPMEAPAAVADLLVADLLVADLPATERHSPDRHSPDRPLLDQSPRPDGGASS